MMQVPQDGKVAVDRLDILANRRLVLPVVRAHRQVLIDSEEREHLAPFGYMRYSLPCHPVRVAILDFPAIKKYPPLAAIEGTGCRLQQGRLACAVGAEHGNDLAFVDLQADTADSHDRTVVRLDIPHFEKRRRHPAASSATPR